MKANSESARITQAIVLFALVEATSLFAVPAKAQSNTPAPASPAPPAITNLTLSRPMPEIITIDSNSVAKVRAVATSRTNDVLTISVGKPGDTNFMSTNNGPLKISAPGPGTLTLTFDSSAKYSNDENGAINIAGREGTNGPTDVNFAMSPEGLVLPMGPKQGVRPYFDIMFGAVTLNPFKISTNASGQFKFTSGDTDTSLIVQIEFARRWAWDIRTNGYHEPKWIGRSSHGLFDRTDFEVRAGYTFDSGSTNASTIIGSGNLNLEFNAGFQLLRESDTNSAMSLNIEGDISSVTDRQFSETHTTLVLGPAWVGSMHIGTNTFYYLARGGVANFALPVVGDGQIIGNDNGTPAFHRVWGAALELEARYDIGQGTISSGARVFPGHTIAPWSLWLGYSVSGAQLGNLATSLTKLL